MRTFCTIITSNYLPYVQALFDSIVSWDDRVEMQVLVVDKPIAGTKRELHPHIKIHYKDHLRGLEVAEKIRQKYFGRNTDFYRWSMKPLYIEYLLTSGYDKVIFLDSDLFFFNDGSFLWEDLDHHDVLLTPHWRTLNPAADAEDFLRNFKDGFFNAGFVGATMRGIDAIKWWGNACLYRCEHNFKLGLFVDQGYLSMFPVLVDKLKVVKHKGCNVATWNDLECRRTQQKGEVLINDEYPIIFIHFSTKLIERMQAGQDSLLRPHLEKYQEKLNFYGAIGKQPGKSWMNFLKFRR